MNVRQNDQVDVSVIICTRNRALQLRDVLESACRLAVPQGLSWEFIIVDNGSSDHTAQIVSDFGERLPVRCLREDKPGISNARNCGVAAARGQYICWTDDDVVIDPNWLAAYAEAFRRHPDAAVFGGRILPVLEPPTPRWFANAKDKWPISTVLAARDFGNEVVPLNWRNGQTPYGANFAMRAVEQRRQIYNSNIGTSPTQKRIGEETDVIHRVMKEGGTGWWVPDAKVNHIIQPQRQSYRYIFHYFRITGESFAYLQDQQPGDSYFVGIENPTSMIRNSPYLYRQIMISALGFGFYHAIGNIDLKLRYLRDLGFYCGVFCYWHNFGRGAANGDRTAVSRRKT